MPPAAPGATTAPRRPARGPGAALFFGGAVLAATKAAWHRVQGRAFVPAPTTGSGAVAGLGHAQAAAVVERLPSARAPAASAAGSTWAALWPMAAGVGALAAGYASRGGRATRGPRPSLDLVASNSRDESALTMFTDGGRRKRLGVGGRVCMLTGAKKYKGITRTFSEKANKRYFRPNTRWKKFWWEREQKWVRLYVCNEAIHEVDKVGIEEMANRAGLDLYAWSKPHWMPGSRQPLKLKVGYHPRCHLDKRLWPDYIGKLNKGAALADIAPAPPTAEPMRWNPFPYTVKKNKPGTPPNPKNVPIRRLNPSKILKIPPEQAA